MELKFDKYTPFRWYALVMLIVTLLMLPQIVNAESGSLIISTSTGATYSPAAGAFPDTEHFNQFLFRNQTFNKLSKIDISAFDGSFVNQVESTSFTIADGGTGSGVVTYTASDGHVIYNFNGDATITAGRVNLTLANPSWATNITVHSGNANYQQPADTPADANPLWMVIGGGTTLRTWRSYTISVQVKSQTENDYTVTYSAGNLFTVSIDKSMSLLQTEINVTNLSKTAYFYETSFNKNSIAPSTFGYVNGIVIFMNTSVDSTFAVVNTTGCVQPCTFGGQSTAGTATPTPSPGGQFNLPLAIPSSGATVQFNQTKYVAGDTLRVEWAISNDSWNGICVLGVCTGEQFAINIFQDGVPYVTTQVPGFIDVGTQIGNASFQVDQASTIRADLNGGITAATNLFSTASVIVIPQQPSNLLISSTVAVGTPVNFSYMWGFTPTLQATGNGIYAVKDGVSLAFTSAGTNIVALTQYNGNITFPEPGTYTVQLKDVSKGVIAFKTVEAINTVIVPTQNISTSFLSLDKQTYMMDDLITATYAIDNFNYTHQKRYEIKNYATGVIEDFGVVSEQTGNLYVPIAPNFVDGLTRFSIRASNNTADYEVIFQNFTVSKLNARGFGMQIFPSGICPGTKLIINMTIPEAATLKITGTKTGDLGFVIKTVTLLNNTVIAFTPTQSIPYTFELIATADNSLQSGITLNPDCTIPGGTTVTPVPGTTINGGGQGAPGTPLGVIDGWTSMFGMGINATSRFLFAIVVIILMTIVGFIITNNNATGGIIIGFIPYAFFTFIEYVPRWFIVIAVIILGIKVRWF